MDCAELLSIRHKRPGARVSVQSNARPVWLNSTQLNSTHGSCSLSLVSRSLLIPQVYPNIGPPSRAHCHLLLLASPRQHHKARPHRTTRQRVSTAICCCWPQPDSITRHGTSKVCEHCHLLLSASTRQFDMARHRMARHLLHATARHRTKRHGTARYSTATPEHCHLLLLASTRQYGTAPHRTARHRTTPHRTARHGTARHGTARHGTARHAMAHHARKHTQVDVCEHRPARQHSVASIVHP